MKTHEFAKHLELLARLLRQLPNTELDQNPTPDLRGLLVGFEPPARDSGRQARPLPGGIEAKLADMSPAEIELYLLSEDEGFTTANLNELAERLGLTTSKRQSKHALANMLTRHFESTKMHAIIRDTKPDETPSSNQGLPAISPTPPSTA